MSAEIIVVICSALAVLFGMGAGCWKVMVFIRAEFGTMEERRIATAAAIHLRLSEIFEQQSDHKSRLAVLEAAKPPKPSTGGSDAPENN